MVGVAGVEEGQGIGVQPQERLTLGWSFAMFFCVLASYFTVRPVRDAMGANLDKGVLAQLFTVVFVLMIVLVPLFGALATRLQRERIVPVVYGVFILNLVAFCVGMHHSGGSVPGWLGASFYVWASIYNLFVVSLFWSAMSDRWTSDEGKRLFGIMAAGGTLGALVGPLIAGQFVRAITVANLPLLSAGFLGLALVAWRQVSSHRPSLPAPSRKSDRGPAFAAMIAGATHVLQSPFLGRIALVIFLGNVVSTFFYLEQARLVKETIPDAARQVEFFASRDLIVSVVTAMLQLLGTAALIKRFGLTAALLALPVTCIAGLMLIGISPDLSVVSGVMALERIVSFGLTGPAMRVLYTVVSADEKYKAQNFNDTVVYRGGDAVSGWMFGFFGMLQLPVAAMIALTLPIACVWGWASVRLGRMQETKAHMLTSR